MGQIYNLFQSLYNDIIFRLSIRTWMEWLDLIVVVVTFYLVLNWARRRQSAFLLRGALLLAIVLFVVTIVLPLPTFDWLVRALLIAIIIAAPVIFHPELRRLLERLGRSAGLTWAVRQTAAEHVVSELVKAIEAMSIKYTGALIVLEGNTTLADIIESGVPIDGQITRDLIESIFYGENPLHDGAVIIREDRIVAAGCVLPLTQRSLFHPERRLGTRHRAAVGVSESSDALVVVVSEETGQVSTARASKLYYALDTNKLRQQLVNFYLPSQPKTPNLSFHRLIKRTGRRFKRVPTLPTRQQLLNQLTLLLVAMLFAITIWSFVIEQTNPPRQKLVENIPLRVEDIPPGTILMNQPPEAISAVVQTTDRAFPIVLPSSLQAVVSLKGLSPGLHHLNVQVNPSLSEARVLSVDPAAVDLELVEVTSRTLPVTVDLSNQQNMSPAYQIVRAPMTRPSQAQVTGPAPLVEQVSQARAKISLSNVTASVQEVQPLEAVDEAGRIVLGVTIQPPQAQVNVTIQRRLNAIDVGVRAVVTDTLPSGYWLSDLRVAPTSVTLQGDPGQLAKFNNGYVETLPVDISGAVGDMTRQIPLDLPPGIQALDGDGNSLRTVEVLAEVTARSSDLVVESHPVELLNVPPGRRVTASPSRIDLLLSGPSPKLNEIAENPELIRVLVDTVGLPRGQNIEVTPRILAPDGIEVQAVPSVVLVSFSES